MTMTDEAPDLGVGDQAADLPPPATPDVLQAQIMPNLPALSLAATLDEPLNIASFSYSLYAMMGEGGAQGGRVPVSGLSWEEQSNELAVRITAQLPDATLEDGTYLPTLITLGTPVAVLCAYADGPWQEVCRGIVEELAPSDGTGGTFEIIAYDPIKALLNSKVDKFYAAGMTPAQIIEDLFTEEGIPLGTIDPTLNSTEVAFPGASVFHGQTIADIMVKTVTDGVSLLSPDQNSRFVIRTDQGKISIVQIGNNQPVYWLRETYNTTSVRERKSITDLVTQVVITGKKSDPGEPPVVAVMVSDYAASYGVRQDIIALTQHVSTDQVEKLARDELNQKGQPKDDRSITAPDVPMIRKFDQIRVTAGTLDGYFSVESISHNETDRTMDVTLGNLTFSPVTGRYTLVDESAIPPEQTTGGMNGSLSPLIIGGGPVSDGQLYQLALSVGFTGNDAIMAVAVALAESRGNPKATNANSNKSTDYGLWQINSCHLHDGGAIPSDPNALFDPVTNAKSAYQIWSVGHSWQPWSTYPAAARSYMDRAQAASRAPASELPASTAAGTSQGASGMPQTALVQAMNQFVNTPYVFGGTTAKGIDCSGFTQNVYSQQGVSLPRTAAEQYAACSVHPSTPQFGDLVFFKGTYGGPDFISHVGIYVGNGQMVSAVEPHVGRQNLNTAYWQSHLAGFGRVG